MDSISRYPAEGDDLEAFGRRVGIGGVEDAERVSSPFGLVLVESNSSGVGRAAYSAMSLDVFPPKGFSDLRR